MKRRFILELRRYWQYHPRYAEDLVDHIQGKYSFRERPQCGIIIKTGGGTRVDLSADNYIGVVNSYVYLVKYKNYPGIAVEWVREDGLAIQKNQGAFPSPPGVYYIELTEDDEFYVDPLLDVYDELVTMVDTSTAQIQNPPLEGTVRLYEMDAGFLLVEGVNYTLTRDGQGNPTGEIILTEPLGTNRYLKVDYKTPSASTGPHKLYPMMANNQAIPGCVLAFGRQNTKGDRFAVVVQDVRRPAALEYGGRWQVVLDFDVTARDVYAQQEIADQTVIYLWGVLRPYLSTEGIEMIDLSLGGESEEIYDETGDDYFFNSSFTLTVETEWSVYVPVSVFLRQAVPLTLEQQRVLAGLSDEEAAQVQSNIEQLYTLNLETIRDPYFGGRSSTFEVIR
jgi:hypothetical protein